MTLVIVFKNTIFIAAVAIVVVAVVTFLTGIFLPVAANFGTDRGGIFIVAGVTGLDSADAAAAIAIGTIVVIALFAGVQLAVAAVIGNIVGNGTAGVAAIVTAAAVFFVIAGFTSEIVFAE